ncbi:restriction endonuclease subunit S [Enterobacter hormaechei]|uniref:restriction endonuclease subunit S n=1 Tax=Enterobacter hormaechei TaxID=158836 RepID=UPI00229B9FCB|nr:restriction endonuclease subunit S [Enterobacter hormaechei]HCU0596641.1 restriction endonuclease subunit S [Enterobacter hormaechei]
MSDKQIVKFGDICREVKLTTKDPIADGYERYIGLEHLDSDSLKIKRWGMIAEDNPSFTRVFKKGHILFGKRRPYLRKAAIAEFDGVCSGDIIVMDPITKKILPSVYHLVFKNRKFWDFAVQTSSGSLSPRTKFSSLKEFEISLAKISEQETLADISTQLSVVDNKIFEILDSSRRFINSFIDSYIVSQVRNIKAEGHQDSRYGRIPKGWEVHELKDVCDLIIDCKNRTPNFYNEGIPVIRTSNIREGKIVWDDMKFTDENDYKIWTERGEPQFGDVIITREAPIGEVCLVPQDTKLCLGQRMMLFRPNKTIVTPEFLRCACLSKFFHRQLLALANGSTVGHVRVGELKKTKVILPGLDLQRKLSEIFNELEKNHEILLEKSRSLTSVFEQIA